MKQEKFSNRIGSNNSSMKNMSRGLEKAESKVKDTAESLLHTGSVSEIIHSITEIGKSLIDGFTSSAQGTLSSVSTTLKSVDSTVKRRPWAFIAGASVTSFTAGFILGSRLSGSSSTDDSEAIH